MQVSTNSELSKSISTSQGRESGSNEIVVLRDKQELHFKVSMEPLGISCEEFGEQSTPQNISKNDYKTSTGIASFVSFLGWGVITESGV